MLTTPSHLILRMFNHGFQEDLLQHFHKDQSKGEQPVAPQILLLLLTLLTWVIFAFFQSLQTFPNQQDFKDY